MSNEPLGTPTITRIGRYDVVAELGRGGMGVVYRGEDRLIGREVAIKTLTEITPELRDRFYVEARSGILNHPNIVTVYEFGEHEGMPYIAMEFVNGDSLEKILRSGRKLTLLETLSIIEQLCSGLGYAHQNRVVHRDIKPANLIVQPDGKVKIVDFGIARLADQSTRLTKTDAVIGTFHYIAPERLKGEMSDGRSDIWSVGVMLYQMLSGELPFNGEDVSTLYKVINEPHPSIRALVPDIPDDLVAIVDRSLAKSPDDRYGTAEEMAFDLQGISDGLKKERVGDLLTSAKRLMEQRQYTSARTVLIDLQRIDPQNLEAKRLTREVQDQINKLQKAEQVRQIVEQAEEAVLSQNYDDAVSYYKQAMKLDTENALQLNEKLENAQRLKDKQDKIRTLWKQAGDARERGDLMSAQEFLGQALKLDEKSTDLRNAYSTVVREMERKAKEGKLQELLSAARQEYTARRFTEAVTRLRAASEIDPTHPEVQKLLHEAATRQEEERRRVLIEQMVGEIQESIYREDYDRALNHINRALEKLPTEARLLQLKAETEKKKREHNAQQIVQSAAQKAQEIFFTSPVEAISIIDKALDQVPGNERLVQMRAQLDEQLKRVKKDELQAQYLKSAHTAIDAHEYDEAIRTLESALIDCGETEELNSLLQYARNEQQANLRQRQTTAVREEALGLMNSGQYEAAVRKLEPAAASTNDPGLKALLERARGVLRDAAQRVESVAARTRALAETDLRGALRLLDSQPPEILGLSQIAALRQEISRKIEVESAIQDAVTRSEEALAKKDLHGGMDALESVRRAYGESPALAQAISAYEAKRRPAANAMFAASIEGARKALLRNEATTALEELRRPANFLEFADSQVQADWKRLVEEATKAAGAKSRVGTDSLPIIVQAKSRTGLYITIALVAVAIIAGAVVLFLRPTGPALQPTFMQLNGTPWATVSRVIDPKGKSVQLPSGDQSTPMRLDGLEPGTYKVIFQGPDNSQQTIDCTLSAEQHQCVVSFGKLDIEQLIGGQK
ncbi:serine/threonine protein kinase [Alloacidobacterium sp.]|uniref:serine/threonine protein kinase n=1 Tax=Alloacidobacterium sp. TaxID=2951999 RepID=UPI002D6B25BA|nr:protein kinase [Alloacidobacterium sp.]HYK35038.1 protein kinase [Alloacidobacterium sp.]